MNRRSEPASQLLVFTVEYLVDMVRRGHVRLPAYARRYVWNQDQTMAFFDSVAKGYPIGTLLFSEGPAPDEEIEFGPLRIAARAEERAYWVVDGQQRLVSLAAALSNSDELDRRFTIAFDLRSESFVSQPSKRDPHVVPLRVLCDTAALRHWFAGAAVDVDLVELASDVAWSIRRYQVAVYVIQGENPAITMQIFERLNTVGVSLRPRELFSAAVSVKNSPGRSRDLSGTAHLIAERTGFGIVDDNTIMRAVAATRSDDFTAISRISIEDLGVAYDEGENALNRAIVFLQETGEVPHVTFLASNYLLIALTRFFAMHSNLDARNLRLLRRWLWRASLVHAGSKHGGSPRLLRRYLHDISIRPASQTLQSMLRGIPEPSVGYPSIDKFQAGASITKMLLCAWWKRGPKDICNGKKITRSELSVAIAADTTARRAVPAIYLDIENHFSRTANRILLPTSGGTSGSVAPLFLSSMDNLNGSEQFDVLRSHFITDEEFQALLERRTDDFLRSRVRILDYQFRNFIDSMCEWDLEDTPSLDDLIFDESDSDGFA